MYNNQSMKAFAEIATFSELTNWLAASMENGLDLDWPLYQGSLGEDSFGGTDVSVYSKINRRGILTIYSQDGVCPDDFDTDISERVQEEYTKAGFPGKIAKAIDIQISYVECIMPIPIFQKILPFLEDRLNTFILYHPRTGDQIAYGINSKGFLVPFERIPHANTTVIMTTSGQEVSYPRPLNEEVFTKTPSHVQDLLGKHSNNSFYRDTLYFLNIGGAHPALFKDLLLGDYVHISFHSPEECTFPQSAGQELLDILIESKV